MPEDHGYPPSYPPMWLAPSVDDLRLWSETAPTWNVDKATFDAWYDKRQCHADCAARGVR